MNNAKSQNDEVEPYSCLTSILGIVALIQIIYTLVVRLSEGGRLCSGDFIEPAELEDAQKSKFYLINEGMFLFWMPLTQVMVVPFSCCCLTMCIPVLMKKIIDDDDDHYYS